MATISACHKDDTPETPPPPVAMRVSTINIGGSVETNYSLTYTSFNKIASFSKTIGTDTQITTYSYNPTSHNLVSYTVVLGDGSSYTSSIIYDAMDKVIGVDSSGSVSDVMETVDGFTIIQSGDTVTYTFNAEEQLTSIQYPTVNINFNSDQTIKGSLHDVEVDRIFYLSILEIIYLTKQGLSTIENYFVPELSFTNTVDASGYLISTIVDGDPTDPSSDTFTVTYAYNNF